MAGVRAYDEAIALCRAAIELDPNFPWPHFHLWKAFREIGKHQEALAECRTTFSLRGNIGVSLALARGFLESGYEGAMREGGRTLVAQRKERYVLPMFIAMMYAHADEKDEAFHWLDTAYDERDPLLVYLNVSPDFDDLRPDFRFQVLLRRMNFPE